MTHSICGNSILCFNGYQFIENSMTRCYFKLLNKETSTNQDTILPFKFIKDQSSIQLMRQTVYPRSNVPKVSSVYVVDDTLIMAFPKAANNKENKTITAFLKVASVCLTRSK